jgi:4-hydroxy-tetrahydrodipicolinate synthase
MIEAHFHDKPGPHLIAIGGPGGSGKTTFAEKLRERLSGCGVIHLDNYKTARSERAEKNLAGPHPEANRMRLAVDHLAAVKSGNTISLPVYDHTTGDTGSFEEYIPQRFNLIEGEISTYAEFRHLVDFSMFIDSDLKTQLAARTGRDVQVLGHSLEKALHTFLVSNLTAFTSFGAESKHQADLHLFLHEDYLYTIEAVRTELLPQFSSLFDDATRVVPEGLIVPVATPFEKDLTICQPAYIDHLAMLSNKLVTRIIIGGTTAEFFSLTVAERLTLLKLGREYFPGLIIFNISSDNLPTTLEMAKRADRYGADALICLPPYYYANAPVEGLIVYFKEVAATTALPLYLYNFPRHTGNPISSNLLKSVKHAGIKDSAGDLSLIPHTSRYLLGGDSKIVEAYRAGACGFVPGLPNVFPEIYLRLEQALGENRFSDAEAIQNKINDFKKTLPKVSGIVTVKKLLGATVKGYPEHVRPPLDAAPGAQLTSSHRLE